MNDVLVYMCVSTYTHIHTRTHDINTQMYIFGYIHKNIHALYIHAHKQIHLTQSLTIHFSHLSGMPGVPGSPGMTGTPGAPGHSGSDGRDGQRGTCLDTCYMCIYTCVSMRMQFLLVCMFMCVYVYFDVYLRDTFHANFDHAIFFYRYAGLSRGTGNADIPVLHAPGVRDGA
jgi:hypothetical protein